MLDLEPLEEDDDARDALSQIPCLTDLIRSPPPTPRNPNPPFPQSCAPDRNVPRRQWPCISASKQEHSQTDSSPQNPTSLSPYNPALPTSPGTRTTGLPNRCSLGRKYNPLLPNRPSGMGRIRRCMLVQGPLLLPSSPFTFSSRIGCPIGGDCRVEADIGDRNECSI